jgi:GT2 family glycosyltransferase
MKPLISIIIPTYNLPAYFNPCVQSIIDTGILKEQAELIVVNNGSQPIKNQLKNFYPSIKVLDSGKNLGWEGGLDFGLKEAQGEFICFQNDDTFIPKACNNFYQQLMIPFQIPETAAVGPATTNAAGWHSIFNGRPLQSITEVSFLIFFTVMVKRTDLDAVGGIDLSAPGGDDFDLSIRLRAAGKKLFINPDAFIIHHAFKTGERVRGESSVAGGWNSKEMTDSTNKWLIQKHGFKKFLHTRRGLLV